MANSLISNALSQVGMVMGVRVERDLFRGIAEEISSRRSKCLQRDRQASGLVRRVIGYIFLQITFRILEGGGSSAVVGLGRAFSIWQPRTGLATTCQLRNLSSLSSSSSFALPPSTFCLTPIQTIAHVGSTASHCPSPTKLARRLPFCSQQG